MQRDLTVLRKLLVLGEQGVGKSSLLDRFAYDTFSENYLGTIGVDFMIKVVDLDGMETKLQFWDASGAFRFRAINTAHYRGASGCILVYDCTDNQSFENIKDWISQIHSNVSPNVPILLIGNKCDKPNRIVTTEQGMALAQELGLYFYETSAKSNINVSQAFFRLARDVKNRLSMHESW